jgi:hypothetical protein
LLPVPNADSCDPCANDTRSNNARADHGRADNRCDAATDPLPD